MIEIKYRWQDNEEETSENEDNNIEKENKDPPPIESSMLWIKVLCDRQAKDHDEILK